MKPANADARIGRRSFLAYGSVASGLLADGRMAWGAAKVNSAASIVTTTAGKIRGAMQDRVHAFKGIPYGASTEGAGRFLPPSKPQPWTSVREALEYGPASPQIPSNLVPESMAQQPPTDASDLLKVPITMSISCSTPMCSAAPAPVGPSTPKPCASST